MPQLCTFGAAAARGFGLTEESAQLPDDQFNLTTLLLPGNGTNGAQNNTFLDSSTNNFTITRNGNTTQGTFSPFSFGGGTAPADGYYSGYFDGSGDYLTIPELSIPSSTSFTIEFWVYWQALPASYTMFISDDNGNSSKYIAYNRSANVLDVQTGTSAATGASCSFTPVANTWYHLAFVRNVTSITIYVNGVAQSMTQGTQANAFLDQGTINYIGRWAGATPYELNGYLSNLRAVVGTAVYTANFTVPTTPLTNITNSQLLTCQSSQFTDNSTAAKTITVVGNTRPTVVNPFGMTDWSGYFDGTGDYLTVANNAAFDLGSGNATIEAWIYPTSSGQTCGIFDKRSSGANYSQFPQIALVSGAFVAYVSYSGSSWAGTINGATPVANAWTHVAFVRSGNTWTLYVNGAVSGTPFTASGSVYTSTDSLVIGASTTTGTNAFAGQISNARVVKGTAVYTANFTVPTAPLTAITNTSLLTCQSSTFVDNSTNAFTITVNGNAYTGTLNNPFNSPVNYTTPPLQTWSTYQSDSVNNYFNFSTSAGTLFQFDNNYTIEMWVYFPSIGGDGSLYVTTNGSTYHAINVDSTNYNIYLNSASPTSSFAHGISLNQWTHVAMVRNGSTITVYTNGVSKGTITNSSTNGYSSPTIARNGGGITQSRYTSNYRVVKGTAVYTAAFTPPTEPLTAILGTSLLSSQSNRLVDNSINALTLTLTGSVTVQAFGPFNPTEAYSAANVGGAGYFDGTGDYLSVSAQTALGMGSGNFTYEAWVYVNESVPTNANRCLFDGRVSSATGCGIYTSADTGNTSKLVYATNSAIVAASTNTIPQFAWTHIAVTRSGTTVRGFINGALEFTYTDSRTFATSAATNVGADVAGTSTFNGYISGARILKGTAQYISAFTPPAAPGTAITNTSLLLNYTNAGIPDATAKNVLETVGNAQISTAQSKFGGSSMYFDKTDDRLTFPSSQNYNFGTGDFTIEFWMNSNDVSGANTPGILQTSDTVGGLKTTYTSGLCIFQGSTATGSAQNGAMCLNIVGSAVGTNAGGVVTTGAWYHIAVVRSSGVVKMYINGTAQPVTATVTGNVPGQYLVVGGYYNTSYLYSGYLNDLRVTKGYARYTTNFTPPTQAFPLL